MCVCAMVKSCETIKRIPLMRLLVCLPASGAGRSVAACSSLDAYTHAVERHTALSTQDARKKCGSGQCVFAR